MPAKYPDAIGYLSELVSTVGEEWFTMICDLATISGKSTLEQQKIEMLFALFTKKACYLGIGPGTTPASSTPVVVSTDFLETLSSFSNFKLLQSTLQIVFTKRITLVFGANGSGKSSLCESLKVLASHETPNRPLHNVRATDTIEPGFKCKFKSDTASKTWTPSVGYGPRRRIVKYFDTGIAVKNVKDSVEPGRVIELTPFKLHIFELTKAFTTKFRETLRQVKSNNTENLGQALKEVRTQFAEFKSRPLASIDEKSLSSLVAEIKLGEMFTQYNLLKEKQAEEAELEKAASEEGLKLLKAEHRELDVFLSSVNTLTDSAEGLWILQPVAKAKDLAVKQEAQKLIAKALIPENGTLENLLSLLRPASVLCNLEAPEHQACPLCKRGLNEPEVVLFKRYYELLSGELENELVALRADLTKAADFIKAVGAVNRKEWEKCSTLPMDMFADTKANSELIIGYCGLEKEPTAEAQKALASLKALSTKGKQLLEQKTKAIEASAKGKDELVKQLEKLRGEIEPLKYAQLIAARLELLKEVQRMADEDGGSTYQEISKSRFRTMQIILPAKQLLQEFEEKAYYILCQVRILLKQISKLSDARDLLLPRLMNGEIAV